MPKLRHVYATLIQTPDPKRWHIQYNSEIVLMGSTSPRRDMQQYLDEKGIAGQLIFLDSTSGKPRSLLHLPIAARKGKGAPLTAEPEASA